MTMLFPKSKEEWLALRADHISSTESSALFGMNPYSTAFELAVIKKSKDLEAYEQNERMQWGLRLQRVIAEGIAEDYGVKIRAVSGYASRLPEDRIGASFDFEIVGVTQDVVANEDLRSMYRQHGPGVLEIKNVDAWIFKQQWSEVDTTEGRKAIEAPAHIELQVQHQLECIEREWSAIGVLVGGNRQILILRMRDREVGHAIRIKTDRFYKLLAGGEMPPVTLPEDAQIIRKIYGISEPGKIIDGQDGDDYEELHGLVAAHAEATQLKASAEKHHQSTGAALMMALGTAEKALFKDFTVSASMVAPTRVEAYDRAGYRNLRVYKKKAKGEK